MTQVEKLLNHRDMELMKMAMLKHEETFRHQVHELHRLYRVQKQLMMMSGPAGCRRQRRRHPRRAPDLHLPADEYIVATPPRRSREDELELTLAIGGGRRRKGWDDVDGSATSTTLMAQQSSDCSGGTGSPSSSSTWTDVSVSPCCQRAVAFRLHEGTAVRQQQQQPRGRGSCSASALARMAWDVESN